MSHNAEKGAGGCVYEDTSSDRPMCRLPSYETGFEVVPEHRWCWSHARWESISPPAETDGGAA